MDIVYHLCDNCKARIADSNWLMHSSICYKHNYWCNSCNISVAKYNKKEHDKLHEYIKCNCGKNIENLKYNIHLIEECEKRLVDCQYCNMKVIYCDKDEHEEMCGSRTDICDDCGNRIMIKNMITHNCIKVECPICDMKFDDDVQLQIHYINGHLC